MFCKSGASCIWYTIRSRLSGFAAVFYAHVNLSYGSLWFKLDWFDLLWVFCTTCTITRLPKKVLWLTFLGWCDRAYYWCSFLAFSCLFPLLFSVDTAISLLLSVGLIHCCVVVQIKFMKINQWRLGLYRIISFVCSDLRACVCYAGLRRRHSSSQLSAGWSERPEGWYWVGAREDCRLPESAHRLGCGGVSCWCRQAHVATRSLRHTQNRSPSQHLVVSRQHHSICLPGSTQH